jgi:hypothetical protein
MEAYPYLFFAFIAFFLSTIRLRRGTRPLELTLNSLLLIGIALDIYAGLLARDGYLWAFIILPVANQFLLVLVENIRRLIHNHN